MSKGILTAILLVLGVVLGGYLLLNRSAGTNGQGSAQAQNHADSDQQYSGPYDVMENWPKPLSTLWPEEKGWTWGSTQAIYAQNPNRVFISQRGQLPAIPACRGDVDSIFNPDCKPVPVEVSGLGEGGRSVWLTVPTPLLPPRNASVGITSSPGEPHIKFVHTEGRDYKWQHLIFAVDAEGNLVDDWSQWDSKFKRVHKILISPYDADKRVWIVDDGNHAIYVFSNDGKQLLQTIGTPGERGSDDKHFNRQTDIAWLPDGTFFVSDGYENTRVVKFDKDGKYVTAWGQPSWDWQTRKDVPGVPQNPPPPNYFHTVHGIQADPVTKRVFVSDRENHRIQVFDENGKFLDVWPLGKIASIYHLLMTEDRNLWMSDGHGTFKIYKYNLDGKMLYNWGTAGAHAGMLWGVHEISTDQDGNFFTAEVFNGRAQKFRPRPGADPSQLVGKQMRVAWKD